MISDAKFTSENYEHLYLQRGGEKRQVAEEESGVSAGQLPGAELEVLHLDPPLAARLGSGERREEGVGETVHDAVAVVAVAAPGVQPVLQASGDLHVHLTVESWISLGDGFEWFILASQ